MVLMHPNWVNSQYQIPDQFLQIQA